MEELALKPISRDSVVDVKGAAFAGTRPEDRHAERNAVSLSCLSVSKFRGLSSASLKHLKRMNVLVGQTNTGKSSFLQAAFFSSALVSDTSESTQLKDVELFAEICHKGEFVLCPKTGDGDPRIKITLNVGEGEKPVELAGRIESNQLKCDPGVQHSSSTAFSCDIYSYGQGRVPRIQQLMDDGNIRTSTSDLLGPDFPSSGSLLQDPEEFWRTGLGDRQMIFLAVQLVKQALAPADLIVCTIDEPTQHMHWDMTCKLASFLSRLVQQFKHLQLFISTHSMDLVKALRIRDEKNTSFYHGNVEKKWTRIKSFDKFDLKSLCRFYDVGRGIIVEGQSDCTVLQMFYPELENSYHFIVDRTYTTNCQMARVYADDMRKRHHGAKLFVLSDRDYSGKESKQKDKEQLATGYLVFKTFDAVELESGIMELDCIAELVCKLGASETLDKARELLLECLMSKDMEKERIWCIRKICNDRYKLGDRISEFKEKWTEFVDPSSLWEDADWKHIMATFWQVFSKKHLGENPIDGKLYSIVHLLIREGLFPPAIKRVKADIDEFFN